MKKITYIIPFLFLIMVFSSTVFAQDGSGAPPKPDGSGVGGGSTITLDNPFRTGGNLFQLLKVIINDIVLPVGGVLAVLAFIYAGFKYVVAQGDPKKIEEAHKALLYTVIGTAILLGAWLITGVITNTIDQLKS